MDSNLWCKLGILTQSKGSAVFCEDESVMLAAVHGPTKITSGQVLEGKGCVKCVYRAEIGRRSDPKEKFKASFIKCICEAAIAVSLYPRACIMINIQEIQYPEHMFSCAINAVCLACLNAGLNMNFLFAATTCYLTKQNDMILSSESNENQEIKAVFTFVFNNTNYDIIANNSLGSFSELDYNKSILVSREKSKMIFNFFKESIR